jgi:hypothetical protein
VSLTVCSDLPAHTSADELLGLDISRTVNIDLIDIRWLQTSRSVRDGEWKRLIEWNVGMLAAALVAER